MMAVGPIIYAVCSNLCYLVHHTLHGRKTGLIWSRTFVGLYRLGFRDIQYEAWRLKRFTSIPPKGLGK
ncbi:MAG: hypothetical protein QOH35_5542 [Acidobacteriaceae bacterium]|jgi:hypothetical protein|nr:hypothetical protein [Acidobacteriaceae bacterium]MEA2544176.1 hypothetical protein [Acidobacteriaceae bacterium]